MKDMGNWMDFVHHVGAEIKEVFQTKRSGTIQKGLEGRMDKTPVIVSTLALISVIWFFYTYRNDMPESYIMYGVIAGAMCATGIIMGVIGTREQRFKEVRKQHKGAEK